MIEHIIFDLGQVLVNVVFVDFAKRMAQVFEIDPALILNAEENGPHTAFMTGEISGEEFHRRLCHDLGKDVPLNTFKEIWHSMLDGQKEDTVEIVQELHEKGHSLALLSNVDVWHYTYCERNYPVLKLFPQKFLSFELRLKKPDTKIFELVANELESAPEHCLLIDDKLENIEAAKKVGYQTIQFVDANKLKNELSRLKLL